MKKTLVWLFVLLSYLSLAENSAVKPKGSGSAEDPYLVDRIENLVWFGENSSQCADKHFKMTADINASETRGWNDAKGFVPLGHFNGTFDGGGHYISNLYIASPTKDAALFTSLGKQAPRPFPFSTNSYEKTLESIRTDTCVKNLALLNCSISGDETACGLAKSIDLARISDVYVSGTLLSKKTLAGFAITCSNSYIEGCSVDIFYQNRNCASGGMFKRAENVVIRNCLILGKFHSCEESPEIEKLQPKKQSYVKSYGGKPKPPKPMKKYDLVCVAGGNIRLINSLMLTKFPTPFIHKGRDINMGRDIGIFPGNAENSFYSREHLHIKNSFGQYPKACLNNDKLIKKETYKGWDFDTVWEIEDGVSFPKLRKLEKMLKRQ